MLLGRRVSDGKLVEFHLWNVEWYDKLNGWWALRVRGTSHDCGLTWVCIDGISTRDQVRDLCMNAARLRGVPVAQLDGATAS